MTVKYSDFKKVTLDDRKIFSEFFKRYPQVHSESAFGTIYCWENYSPCKYAITDDHLIISCHEPGNISFRAPIGEFDSELFEDVFSLALEYGGAHPLSFPDAQYLQYMKENKPEYQLHPDRGYFEYYYKTEDLAKLCGKKYLNIRGQINSFKKRYNYTVEKISADNSDEIKSMVCEWEKTKQLNAGSLIEGDRNALFLALDNIEALKFEGIAIREKDKICAAALWEELNKSTALIHFEKALTSYEGAYKIINYETAKTLLGRYEWINRESDVNQPGLREAKLRYHPSGFAEYWYI